MPTFKLDTFGSYNLSCKKVESLHETHHTFRVQEDDTRNVARSKSTISHYINTYSCVYTYVTQSVRARYTVITFERHCTPHAHTHNTYTHTHTCSCINTYVHILTHTPIESTVRDNKRCYSQCSTLYVH